MNIISYSSSNSVKYLILINFIIYLGIFIFSQYSIDLLLALYNPFYIRFKVYQLLTHMFVHSREFFLHIFFNMLTLWVFGIRIEKLLGNHKFLILYFVSGIVGAIFQIAFNIGLIYNYTGILDLSQISYNSVIFNTLDNTQHRALQSVMYAPMIGASSAVAGIVGAFARFFPDNKIFIIPFPFPIAIRKAVIFFISFSLIISFLNYYTEIAHFAHIGGTLTGYFIASYYLHKKF